MGSFVDSVPQQQKKASLRGSRSEKKSFEILKIEKSSEKYEKME
jgi:hypothetical protein